MKRQDLKTLDRQQIWQMLQRLATAKSPPPRLHALGYPRRAAARPGGP